MLFNVAGLAGKSKIEVSLKPEYENGIILYIGARDDGRGDFASLALVNGFVELRYSDLQSMYLIEVACSAVLVLSVIS